VTLHRPLHPLLWTAHVLLGVGLAAPCMTIVPRLGSHTALGGWLGLLDEPRTYSILSGIAEVEAGRGMTGSVELEDRSGAVVTLDFAGGVLRGVEIVVWPKATTVPDLRAPAADRHGRLVVPQRPSQPGVAVLEVDVALSIRRSPDESVMRLGVGSRQAVERVAVAENLLIELDGEGELAGFWLSDIPPFPGPDRA